MCADRIEVQQQCLAPEPKILQNFLLSFSKIVSTSPNYTYNSVNVHHSVFTFGFDHMQKYRYKLIVEAVLKNCGLCLSIGVDLRQFWNIVSKQGTERLYSQINCYNASSGQSFTYQLRQSVKSVWATILITNFGEVDLLSLLTNNIRYLVQFVFPISYGEIQNNKESKPQIIKNIQYVLKILESDRVVRSKASNCLDLPFTFFSIQKKYPEPEEIQKTKFANTLSAFQTKLKNKFEAQQKILRWIKLISFNIDESWKNKDGSQGTVQKVQATYKISSELSINVETNLQIAKIRGLENPAGKSSSSTSTQVQKKEQQIIMTTLLVKKSPLQSEVDKSFLTEKRLLAFLRGQKCYAINYFYCQQSKSIQNVSCFYSSYHDRKIDQKFDKVKVHLKVLLSLCQGLVFLRWNGISHRDLKPDNILLSKDYTAKIIDFGSGCHNRFYRTENPMNKKILSGPCT